MLHKQPNRYNLESAAEFGRIVEIHKKPYYIDETSKFIHDTYEYLCDMNFNIEEDFIALTGRHSLVAFFLALIVKEFGNPRMLLYDPKEGKYIEQRFETPGKQPAK